MKKATVEYFYNCAKRSEIKDITKRINDGINEINRMFGNENLECMLEKKDISLSPAITVDYKVSIACESDETREKALRELFRKSSIPYIVHSDYKLAEKVLKEFGKRFRRLSFGFIFRYRRVVDW